MWDSRNLLTDDHASLGKLLKRVQAALREGNLEAAHAMLDLFWARLAVHIRGEHVHLFPAMLNALKNETANHVPGPSLAEAESVVAALRADHDFFMQELANAVAVMRAILAGSESAVGLLTRAHESIRTVESRLKKHNQIEETRIYHWITTVLSEPQQIELARELRRDLTRRPKRFSAAEWLGDAV